MYGAFHMEIYSVNSRVDTDYTQGMLIMRTFKVPKADDILVSVLMVSEVESVTVILRIWWDGP